MGAPCCRTGHVDAQYRIGIAYLKGVGVEQNAQTAYFWFHVAGINGSEQATVKQGDAADQLSTEEITQATRKANSFIEKLKTQKKPES